MADKFNVSIVDAIRNAQKKKQQEADKKNKYAPVNRSAPQTAQESIQSGQGPVNYVKKSEKKQSPKTSTKQSVQTVQEDVYVEPESPFKPKIERASFQQVMADVMARGEERREQLREQASKQAHKKELKEDKAVRFQNARFVSGDYIEEKDKPKILPGKEQNAFKRRQQEKDKEFKDDVYAEQTQYIRTANQKREAYKADGKIIPESAALDDSGDKLKGFMVQDFYTDYNKRQSLKNESKEQFNNSVSMLGLNSDALSRQRFTSAKDMPKLDAYGYEYSIKQSAKKAGVTPEEYVRNEYRKQGYELKDDFKLSDLHLPKKVGDYILEGYDKETAIPFLNTDKDIIKGDSIKLLNSTKDVGLEYGGGKDLHMAQYMTESEMNYYMFFLGRDGEETARKYLNEIRYKLIDRATKQQQDEEYVKYGAENPVSSYAESLALSIETAGEGALNLMNSAIGRNATDATTRSGNAMNAISQGREDSAKTVIGKGLHIITGGLVENVPSMALNAVAPGAGEVLDFFMGVGQELGQHSRAGTLDNEAVMLDALVAGATEATEFKYIGKFTGKTLNKLAARTGMSGLKAATTSVITSMLNGMGAGFSKSLINSAADYMLMGEDSIYNRSLEMYKAYGFSQEAAEKKALNDAVISPTVSGLLVGGAMGTVYSLPGTVKYSVDFSNRGRQIRNSDIFKGSGYEDVADSVTVETLLRYGMTFGKNTDAGRSAEALYKKYIRGEKISDSQLGAQDVLNHMEYARGEEYRQSITDLTRIEIKHDLADNDLEGMYDNGTIRLSEKPDSNQDDTVRHELSHGIENTESYKRYVELIQEQDSYNKSLAKKKAEYDKRGLEYDDALLRSEVAAEFAKDIIPKKAEDFVRLKRAAENNPSLYDRMYNNIRDLRAKMKAKGGKVFTDKVTGLSVSYADLRKAERYLENALIEVSSTGYNEGSNMYRLRMRADQSVFGMDIVKSINTFNQIQKFDLDKSYGDYQVNEIADGVRKAYKYYEIGNFQSGYDSLRYVGETLSEHVRNNRDGKDVTKIFAEYFEKEYFKSYSASLTFRNTEKYKNDMKLFNTSVGQFVIGLLRGEGVFAGRTTVLTEKSVRDAFTALKQGRDIEDVREILRPSVTDIVNRATVKAEFGNGTKAKYQENRSEATEELITNIIRFYNNEQPAKKETEAITKAQDESKYGVDLEGEFRSLKIKGLTEAEVHAFADVTRNIVNHLEETGSYTKGEFTKFVDNEISKITYARSRTNLDHMKITSTMVKQMDSVASNIIGRKLSNAYDRLAELSKAGKGDTDEGIAVLNEYRHYKNQLNNINEWKNTISGKYRKSNPAKKLDKIGIGNVEFRKALSKRIDDMIIKVSPNDETEMFGIEYLKTRHAYEVFDELVNGTGTGKEEWTEFEMGKAYAAVQDFLDMGDMPMAVEMFLEARRRATQGGKTSQAFSLFYGSSEQCEVLMNRIMHEENIIKQREDDEAFVSEIKTAQAKDELADSEADAELKKTNSEYKSDSETLVKSEKELKEVSEQKKNIAKEEQELVETADELEVMIAKSKRAQEALIEETERRREAEAKARAEAEENIRKSEEYKKKLSSLVHGSEGRYTAAAKRDVENSDTLTHLGIAKDDAYDIVCKFGKWLSIDNIKSIINEHIESVLGEDGRILNPIKYKDAKKEHISALGFLRDEGAEYRDMQKYNENIRLNALGKISDAELEKRNGKMFGRPNGVPFTEEEMRVPKSKYDTALEVVKEKQSAVNLARRQALAFAYRLRAEGNIVFNNSAEKYAAFDEAIDRGEFDSDGIDYSNYKPTDAGYYSIDGITKRPELLNPPALGDTDSISNYLYNLNAHINTLKQIRAKWKQLDEYTTSHNYDVKRESYTGTDSNSDSKNLSVTYLIPETLINPGKYSEGIKLLNSHINELEQTYNKYKAETETERQGWRQDVSDIFGDEEIAELKQRYGISDDKEYSPKELFEIIEQEKIKLQNELNNFVKEIDSKHNEYVSVEQKQKVLRKYVNKLRMKTEKERSSYRLLKETGATDGDLKTHLDTLYDELGVKHVKSADWRFFKEFAMIIDEMDDIDEAIGFILNAAKHRHTAYGTLVYKNLKRAFGGGNPEGSEAEQALYKHNLEQLKGIASQQLHGMLEDAEKVSTGKKLSTLMHMNQLNNFCTSFRNLLANPSFGLLEYINSGNAVLLDKLVSTVSGTRTVGGIKNPFAGIAGFGLRRMLDSVLETQLNVDIIGGSVVEGAPSRRRAFRGSNPISRILAANERLLGYSLSGGDEWAKGTAEKQLRDSFKSLIEKGYLTEGEVDKYVNDEIDFRTFQDNTLPAEILKELHDALNVAGTGKIKGKKTKEFGVGDLIIPYTQVPGNILSRYIEYSPVGYMKAAYHLFDFVSDSVKEHRIKNKEIDMAENPAELNAAQMRKVFSADKQRKFVLSLSRAVTGTGVMALGYTLANCGIISGNPENEYDLEQYERAKHNNKYYINLSQLGRILRFENGDSTEAQQGDYLMDISWVAPWFGLLSTGAYIAHHLPDTGTMTPELLFDAVVKSATDQVMSLPMFFSVNAIKYNYRDAGGFNLGFLTGTAADWALSVLVPQPIKQVAKVAETKTYNPYKGATIYDIAKNKFEQALPGNVGEDAPFRVDIWGELEDNSIGSFWADLANNMLNPSKVTKYKTNILTEEFDRLLKLSKDILPRTPYRSYNYELNGKTYHWELNDHDYQRYAVLLGSTSYKAMTAFVLSEGYDYLPDSYRVQGLEDISKDVDYLVREIWIGIKRGENPNNLQKRIDDFVVKQKDTAGAVIKENAAKEYLKRDGVNVEDVIDTGYYVPYTEQEKADYIGERTQWISEKQKNINNVKSGAWYKNKSKAERDKMVEGWQNSIDAYKKQIDDMVAGRNKDRWVCVTGRFNSLSEEEKNVVLNKLNKDPETIKLPDEVFEDFESYMPKSNAVIDITDGVPFEERALPNGKMDGNKSALDFSFSTEEYDNSVKPDYKPAATENKSEAVKELLNPDTRGFFERHKPEIKSDTEGEVVEEKEKTADDYLAMYTPKEESESGGSGGSKKYYKKYYKKYRKYYSKGKRYYKKSSRGPQLLSNYKGRQSRSGRFRPRFGGGSSGSSEGYSSGRFTPRFNVR